MSSKHLILPDTQIKHGNNLDFIERIGKYIADKRPANIICLGDWADMESLSSYDVGKKSFEGKRYTKDIESAREGMSRLFKPIRELNRSLAKQHKKQYTPKLILTLGNHENRINKAVNNDPKLDGVLSVDDLGYSEWGWDVFDFLDVIVLDGVAYSHFFTTGVMGRPCTSAAAQLNKKHMSCVAGHQQGLQIATGHRADGKLITSVIAGSCYEHDEDYMGPQGNKHWRGILVAHDVHDGQFDLMPVSLSYLEKKYG